MAEKIFGHAIVNGEGRQVPVHGEQHVREDLGRIPSFQAWVSEMHKPWIYGQKLVVKLIA